MKMKKLMILFLSVALIFSFVVMASAVEWKVTNQATIAWDAVTTLADGSVLPAGSIILYEVYLANADTDPNKANPVKLTDPPITALEYIITLNSEGRFIPGVLAIRLDAQGAELGRSTINWADVNGDQTPNPFGLVHYIPPAIPLNLR